MGTFYVPMLAADNGLTPCTKKGEGSWLRMMFIMEEMFNVFHNLRVNDYYVQLIVAYKWFLFASQQCAQHCGGQHIPLSQTRGSAGTLMDVCDEACIERLMWVVYDGVLWPSE